MKKYFDGSRKGFLLTSISALIIMQLKQNWLLQKTWLVCLCARCVSKRFLLRKREEGLITAVSIPFVNCRK